MSSGVNEFVVNVLQSVYGNLPQLVSKVAATNNSTNEEALRYVVESIKRLTSVEHLTRVDQHYDDQVSGLKAELKYLKNYYANHANLRSFYENARQSQTRVNGLRQKLDTAQRELALCRRMLSDRPDVSEQSQKSSNDATVEIERYERKIDELKRQLSEANERMRSNELEYQKQRVALQTKCIRSENTIKNISRELERGKRENDANISRIRSIVHTLSPGEQNIDKVGELLDSFLTKYREQETLLGEMRRLRDIIARDIANGLSGIASLTADRECSDFDYVRKALEALQRDRQALLDKQTERGDFEGSDSELLLKLEQNERVIRDLHETLSENSSQLNALQDEKTKLLDELSNIDKERSILRIERAQHTDRMDELEALMHSLERDIESNKLSTSESSEASVQTVSVNDTASGKDQKYEALLAEHAAVLAEYNDARAKLDQIAKNQAQHDQVVQDLLSDLTENKEQISSIDEAIDAIVATGSTSIDETIEAVATAAEGDSPNTDETATAATNVENSSSIDDTIEAVVAAAAASNESHCDDASCGATARLSDTLVTLQERITEALECVNNDADILKKIDTLRELHAENKLTRADLDELNALNTEDSELQERIRQVNCMFEQMQEADRIIVKTTRFQDQDEHNADVIKALEIVGVADDDDDVERRKKTKPKPTKKAKSNPDTPKLKSRASKPKARIAKSKQPRAYKARLIRPSNRESKNNPVLDASIILKPKLYQKTGRTHQLADEPLLMQDDSSSSASDYPDGTTITDIVMDDGDPVQFIDARTYQAPGKRKRKRDGDAVMTKRKRPRKLSTSSSSSSDNTVIESENTQQQQQQQPEDVASQLPDNVLSFSELSPDPVYENPDYTEPDTPSIVNEEI